MTLAKAQNLTKLFGDRPIIREAGFTIRRGARVGVVGRNGEGKTTLLRLIAGELAPDRGSVVFFGDISRGLQQQDACFDAGGSVMSAAMEAFSELAQMEAELRWLEEQISATAQDGEPGKLLERYGNLSTAYEGAGGYEKEAHARSVLFGLGFAQTDLDRDARTLSGGEKARLALGRLLLQHPTVLLLDEPTNHLDIEAAEWLEGVLREYDGAIVVVSHDRYFLDQVTTETLEVGYGSVQQYPGNYTRFRELKDEQAVRQMKLYEQQQDEVQRLQSFIRRYKAGQRTREAQAREKVLARMEMVEKPLSEERSMGLRFDEERPSGQDVLAVEELARSFGEQDLFSGVSFSARRGERLALVGPNGAGKTTLLRTLLGRETPTRGRVKWGHGVRIGYFAQDLSGLDESAQVVQDILNCGPRMTLSEARDLLGSFHFSGDDVFKTVGSLSGGERSRLLLAKLSLQGANVLLLDEPTNHLDVYAREDLERALLSFPGTIVFVSHDRYFLKRLAGRFLVLCGGRLHDLPGEYEEYRRLWRDGAFAEGPAPAREPADRRLKGKASRGEGRPDGRRPQEQRVEPRRIADLEQSILQLEAQRRDMGRLLGQAEVYRKGRGAELVTEFRRIEDELERLYRCWEEAVRGGLEAE